MHNNHNFLLSHNPTSQQYLFIIVKENYQCCVPYYL